MIFNQAAFIVQLEISENSSFHFENSPLESWKIGQKVTSWAADAQSPMISDSHAP